MSQLFPSNDSNENDNNTGYCSRFQTEFEMLQRLGLGGYGVVFKVICKKDGEMYAIKRNNLTDLPSDVGEREIKFKDFNHENIVKYFDSWIERPPINWQETEDEKWKRKFNCMPIVLKWNRMSEHEKGVVDDHEMNKAEAANFVSPPKSPEYQYIQMELCKDENLADWLLKNDVNKRKEKYLTIFAEIVGGLKYIHSKGIIYRDLKPENILFGLDGRIKIADFGTVTSHDNHVDSGRRRQSFSQKHTDGIGTILYKAPELEGKYYDYEVDVYSLGVILYELITPFHSDAERYDAIERLHNTPFPKDSDDSFKEEFNLLKKMLSRNPKKRPTVTCVEQHVTRWRLIEGETVSPWMPNMFDFLHRFFHYSSQLSHFVFLDKTAVNRDKKEKIVSKNRPLKIKKDNHILQ